MNSGSWSISVFLVSSTVAGVSCLLVTAFMVTAWIFPAVVANLKTFSQFSPFPRRHGLRQLGYWRWFWLRRLADCTWAPGKSLLRLEGCIPTSLRRPWACLLGMCWPWRGCVWLPSVSSLHNLNIHRLYSWARGSWSRGSPESPPSSPWFSSPREGGQGCFSGSTTTQVRVVTYSR